MGQCQPCNRNNAIDATDLRDALNGTGNENSPNSTPNQIKLRKKKKEILMSDLVQEIQGYDNFGSGGTKGKNPEEGDDLKELQKLYSSEIKFDNFEVIKVIGRGSYAKVYLIKKNSASTPEYYALKVLKKKALYDRNLMHHTV